MGLDTIEDLTLLREIYKNLGKNGEYFNANDIIEFNGSAWVVSFDSSVTSTTQYVINSTTSKQFEWTGEEWIDSYEGIYRGGFWRVYL